MTAPALERIRDEVASIEAELGFAGTGRHGGTVGFDQARLRERLDALRAAVRRAHVVHDAGVAAVGRRVLVLDDDDEEPATYALVLPGDGDPVHGWLSLDAPLGAALAGRRAGDLVRVDAPGGQRRVRLLVVE